MNIKHFLIYILLKLNGNEGAKYYGYCSDITVTFPSGWKFNDK